LILQDSKQSRDQQERLKRGFSHELSRMGLRDTRAGSRALVFCCSPIDYDAFMKRRGAGQHG
jgi:hypothetical protein